MPKRAKALTNFYSSEFGSVSVGDEMQIATAETFNELMNAGYIEEIGTVQDGSISAERSTASASQRNAKARKSAKMDTEFASEMGATSTDVANAQAKASAEANAQANSYAQEFSQELGSAEANNTPNQMGKATKQAQANLNKVNDDK